VILNTMFEMDQAKYDKACPENFQSAGAMHRLRISPAYDGEAREFCLWSTRAPWNI
jgi:hypothetical protein